MIVVSDTTPILSLLKAGYLDLLYEMFGEVLIPDAVYKELTINPSYQEEAEIIKQCPFLRVEKLKNKKSAEILRKVTGLDAGESEAIILVDESQADLLVIDEHKGRQVARKMGIVFTGTIGILLQAYDKKNLTKSEVEHCITKLKENDIRISKELCRIIDEHIAEG